MGSKTEHLRKRETGVILSLMVLMALVIGAVGSGGDKTEVVKQYAKSAVASYEGEGLGFWTSKNRTRT